MYRSLTLCCLVVFVVTALSGCGGGLGDRPEVHPVSGKVLMNGEPVEGAHVTFRTEESPRSARGTTDAEGAFELTTFDTGDGAVAGEHVVTITKPSKADDTESIAYDPENPSSAYGDAMEAAATEDDEEDLALPPEYANPDTTPLKREVVPESPNEFTFELGGA